LYIQEKLSFIEIELACFFRFLSHTFNAMIMSMIPGKKVAILTEDGFEEEELTSPKKALEEAGARVYIVSTHKGRVKAWKHDHWTMELPVDVTLDEAKEENFDALVLPGGVMNPDRLRTNRKAVAFAEQFLQKQKLVAAICHGPQLLIETNQLKSRKLTSYPSVHTDLVNAGAIWDDQELIVDGNLITSRSPKDLPAFNKQLIKMLSAGTKDERGDSQEKDGLVFKYSQSMQ
jgi:protease I